MSSLTPEKGSGKLHLLKCCPEDAEPEPFWGVEHLARARLAVVCPGVSAAVLRHVPDLTPVIVLPSGLAGPVETAVDLARHVVAEGDLVAWLHAGNFGAIRMTPAHDVARWFHGHGIEWEVIAEEAPSRSLAGSWVLAARPRHQAAETVHRLRALGATVISQPAIAVGPPADPAPLDAALARLESYDWLVFSSANGVRFFVERLWDRSGDLRRLGGLKLAAVGPGTAEALAQYRLRADAVPHEHRAEALAETLAAEAKGRRFLLARASRGREVLAEVLRAAGAEVDQVVVYQSTDLAPDETRLRPVLRLLDDGRLDWVVVSSSAIARSLGRLFGPRLAKTRLASISPITSGVLRGLGYEPAVEAKQYTLEGIVEAMLGGGLN